MQTDKPFLIVVAVLLLVALILVAGVKLDSARVEAEIRRELVE